MEKMVMDIFLWVTLGSIVVLIIMNPSGFASAVTSVGGFIDNTATILSGSNYGGGGAGTGAKLAKTKKGG
jgi:hypothetical protein